MSISFSVIILFREMLELRSNYGMPVRNTTSDFWLIFDADEIVFYYYEWPVPLLSAFIDAFAGFVENLLELFCRLLMFVLLSSIINYLRKLKVGLAFGGVSLFPSLKTSGDFIGFYSITVLPVFCGAAWKFDFRCILGEQKREFFIDLWILLCLSIQSSSSWITCSESSSLG